MQNIKKLNIVIISSRITLSYFPQKNKENLQQIYFHVGTS